MYENIVILSKVFKFVDKVCYSLDEICGDKCLVDYSSKCYCGDTPAFDALARKYCCNQRHETCKIQGMFCKAKKS